MSEKVLESLDQFRYLLLAMSMLGVLALVAKAYGIGVEKEGLSAALAVKQKKVADIAAAGQAASDIYEQARIDKENLARAEKNVKEQIDLLEKAKNKVEQLVKERDDTKATLKAKEDTNFKTAVLTYNKLNARAMNFKIAPPVRVPLADPREFARRYEYGMAQKEQTERQELLMRAQAAYTKAVAAVNK